MIKLILTTKSLSGVIHDHAVYNEMIPALEAYDTFDMSDQLYKYLYIEDNGYRVELMWKVGP